MDVLNVYLNERHVGRLSETDGVLSFSYLPDYVAQGSGEPLSLSLPVRAEPYAHGEVEPFLSNLLPDDIIRTRIAAILQIPRENTFALLKALGGDCAGAIAFFPEGQTPETPSAKFRELTDEEAGRILDNLEHRPLDVGEDGFRISGAGAQDKLIACFADGRISLPLQGTPSTHIIKNPLHDYPDSVENEFFVMQLARACGIRAASCAIRRIGGRLRYVTERYDRIVENGVVRRLHQEDFCQMLKVVPSHKYESVGGPGIRDCFALLRTAHLPASDTVEFLDRLIFNFLIGNGDAHGKNFSVLYHGRQARLAPAYDLMSTAIYPEVGKRMAMKIDGEYAFKWITRGKFLRMAESCGLGAKLVERELNRLSRLMLRQSEKWSAICNQEHPSACYTRIVDGLAARVRQIESSAG